MPRGVYEHKAQPIADRFWAKVERSSASSCWLWTGYRDSRGYGSFQRGRGVGTLPAHRMAYELAVGSLAAGMEIMHACDNPPCCNPAHLSQGTHKENQADMAAKGRNRRGEAVKGSKLSAELVTTIRQLAIGGKSDGAIAAEFGVDAETIRGIRLRRRWRHVP